MKRYIQAFAYSRKKARDTINSFAYKLNEHIIKCIIFGNYRPESLNHWIDEIVNWLIECDKSHIQQANLKKHDYEDTIFEFFADDESETRYGLVHFEKTNLEKYQGTSVSLPYFSINSNMVKSLYNCYCDLRDICISRFKNKDEHSRESWTSIVRAIVVDNMYEFKESDIIDSTFSL